jgi:hypothetical protein
MATIYISLLGLCLSSLVAAAQPLVATRFLSTNDQAASLEQATMRLVASNVISEGLLVEYKAGQAVELLPGFSARVGTVFLAHTGTVSLPAIGKSQSESGRGLHVNVLGNPVEGKSVEVEIRGIAGQAVQLNLMDLQGKVLHQQRLEEAGSIERVSVPIGAGKGLLLLQVNTAQEHQQLKLLKP